VSWENTLVVKACSTRVSVADNCGLNVQGIRREELQLNSTEFTVVILSNYFAPSGYFSLLLRCLPPPPPTLGISMAYGRCFVSLREKNSWQLASTFRKACREVEGMVSIQCPSGWGDRGIKHEVSPSHFTRSLVYGSLSEFFRDLLKRNCNTLMKEILRFALLVTRTQSSL
jgi:hypothetical protein